MAKSRTKIEVKASNKSNLFNPISEARETAATTLKLMISALTLVAGLAWNEFIKKFAEVYIGKWFKDLGEVIGLLIYAVVLTIVVVLIVSRLKKISGKIKRKV